ncbi:hypothetical protein X740_21020 [Mesorhizobium sp. LNHC221B00]|nr:hypothetical protein [Mesorhizobium sp. LNHC221B00]ESY78463.1 hypothetical protein X740_21020 [Mesorhizobium sp. LNHC221B00]
MRGARLLIQRVAADVSETLRDVEWIVSLIDAREEAPKRPAT